MNTAKKGEREIIVNVMFSEKSRGDGFQSTSGGLGFLHEQKYYFHCNRIEIPETMPSTDLPKGPKSTPRRKESLFNKQSQENWVSM